MLFVINKIVYSENAAFAGKNANFFANEASREIDGKFKVVAGLLSLAGENLSEYSQNGSSEEAAEYLMGSVLKAAPYLKCAWFAFEPGTYLPDKRFAKSYISKYGVIKEVSVFADNFRDNPYSSSWYYIPLTSGEAFFSVINQYDYQVGDGHEYVGIVTYPIKRGNQTIGCVGVDIDYSELFGFFDKTPITNSGEMFLFAGDGTIVYSKNEEHLQKSLWSFSFDDNSKIIDNMNKRVAFSHEGYSPFLRKNSLMQFIPIFSEFTDSLYLYVDMPTDSLYANAQKSLRYIILTGLLGLTLFAGMLFYSTRNIVRPIVRITETANKIAAGSLDVEVDKIYETKKTKNEVDILSIALKKMLAQLTQMQKLKLEAVESRHEKEKAEQSSRAKTNFLAKMSHEIRTPMNAIIGMSQLILQEHLPPRVYEQALSIKNASNNLLSIINDILDFSKIESGKLEIIPTKYLFASVINDVISIIRMRLIDKPILFAANIDSGIPYELIGDEGRIRQILLNLLSNAVKYTKEGFVIITIDSVILKEGVVELIVEISDSGIGIKEENIGRLFEDFAQFDTVKNRAIQGTGLGLTITKNLCEAMGGKISVSSEYGTGSVFTVIIPQRFESRERFAQVDNPENKRVLIYEPRSIYACSIACSLDNLKVNHFLADNDSEFLEAVQQHDYQFIFVSSFLYDRVKKISDKLDSSAKLVVLSEVEENGTANTAITLAMPAHVISIANILNDAPGATTYKGGSFDVRFTAPGARVLIVDDINTNLKVAEGLMLPYKMQVSACQNGIDAVQMVRNNEYDIVFMDHMMPEMDGIEATQIIRSISDSDEKRRGYYQNLPIIALTANAVSGVREMFLANGFSDFLAKPIEIAKLNNMLERWIPKKKQKKHLAARTLPDVPDFKIAGIDIKRGLFLTGGSIENYKKTLAVFHKDGLRKINEIKDCLAANRLQLYTTFVHALKSATANIGAKGLSEKAKLLEAAGKNEDIAFIEKNTEIFLLELKALLQNINTTLLSLPDDSEAEADTPGEAILRQQLATAREALAKMDIGKADAVMSALYAQKWDKKTKGNLEMISEKILLFEYDKASGIIDEMLRNGD